MSSDIQLSKCDLFSIHIIEEGVSVHNKNYDDFLNIDSILVFGFISALYNYTFSMGHEEVDSIDFGTCKFLFEPLYDGKLLVIISKKAFDKEKEKKLLQSITTKYEIITRTKNLDDIDSLLDIKEKFIPLDLVAEIRKKGKTKPAAILDDGLIVVPSITIPDVKVEEFFLESLMNESKLTEKVVSQIKKPLSNFFLGYKNLIAGMFVIAKQEEMTSFVFSRKSIDETFPLIQYAIDNPSISETELEADTNQIKQIDIKDQKLWILTHASSKYSARAVFFSLLKDELLSMERHLSRIMYFINKKI